MTLNTPTTTTFALHFGWDGSPEIARKRGWPGDFTFVSGSWWDGSPEPQRKRGWGDA
jgi:hypothetical protein